MPPYKPRYIYGLHDPGGEHIMAEKGKNGWVLFVHAIGLDAASCSGHDYTPQANAGFGVIARLNHGYEPQGTIPRSSAYPAFAQACAAWVSKSRGCNIWIIGNETNFAVERPGVKYDRGKNPPVLVEPGEVITPALYARCYTLCRDAIRRVPGHETDEVLIGAVAPWNAQTTYPGNASGDWILYFRDILRLVGRPRCDGITIHTYTHGSDPQLVYTPTKFKNPPFNRYYYDFLAYQDFMRAIPYTMRDLPVYITETDQNDEWKNQNTGWVQRAYGEIDHWNKQPGHQQILALLLYRWPRAHDKWGIEGKDGVIEDFKAAMNYDYVRRSDPVPLVYGIEWVEHTTPAKMISGARHNVEVKLRNTGNAPWECDGEMAVSLRSRWYKDGKPLTGASASDTLTRLPADVAPKALVTVKAAAKAPAQSGSLVLAWDLVDADGTWSERRCTPLRVPISVDSPPPTDEVYFESTKCTVKGVFLDFYRRYGEEITGLPITEQFVDGQSGLQTQVFQRVILENAQGTPRLVSAGQYLQEAKSEIALLQSQTQELRRQMLGRGIVPPPAIEDVTEALPREKAKLAAREAVKVRYLVIHHSGVAKDVELRSIALAHQRRGWPSIIYQFYVDRSGKVFRTNPDEQVVSSKEEWSASGINVCFAGHFSQEVPTDAQIVSGGQLCAWLLQVYGLTPEAVVGISKFYATVSPGSNWTAGQNWSAALLTQVDKVRSSAEPGGAAEPGEMAALRSQLAQSQRDLEELTAQIAALQKENRRLRSQCSERGVPPPTIDDITEALPRDTAGLRKRELTAIRSLVIHHTALPPSEGAERVAAAHRAAGWPGTMVHFFIDHLGRVQQTSSLQHYVSDESPWLREAVNICFAGNFDQEIPNDAQLASGGELCAWLLADLKLPSDRVLGAREIYGTESPGTQWLQGRQWKTLLGETIQKWQDVASPTGSDVEALSAHIATLEANLSTAQAEAATLEKERDHLQQRVNALEEEVNRLQAACTDDDAARREILALQEQLKKAQERILQLDNGAKQLQGRQLDQVTVPKPVIQDIVDELPKHQTLKYSNRPVTDITHVAVHHSAATASIHPKRIAEYHIKDDSGRNKDAWPGIGYHYYLMPDGTIYQTNRHETVSYHAGGNNAHTLGICFAGTFMDVIPTPKQVRSGGHLIAWLTQQLNISVDNVWGHKEYPNNHTTLCPGKQWLEDRRWKETLLEQVHARLYGLPDPLNKPIRHCLLFWWRSPDLWAVKDWLNARSYIARFRPVCAFSEETAMQAEYVLIVGGTAGVSGQSEENLRQAGCQVERAAGVDEPDTKKMLDALVASNRPFKTLTPEHPWWL